MKLLTGSFSIGISINISFLYTSAGVMNLFASRDIA